MSSILIDRLKSINQVQLGFGIIILLIVVVTSGVLYQTYRTNEIITNLVEVNNLKIKHVTKMREAIRLRVISVSNILSTDDEFERDDEIMRFHGHATQYVIARAELLKLPMDEKERQLLDKVTESIKIIQPFTAALVEKAGDHEPISELKRLEKQGHVKREATFQHLDELVNLQQDYSQQALVKIRKMNAHARLVTVSLMLLVLITSLIIATIVSRTVEKKNSALLTAYKEAHEAMRSKSAFLANMSHEIRTPITAIIGFAESTFFSNQTMEMRYESIRTIIESGKHLLHIINDVLDISKIEANKLDVELVPTPLAKIIKGAENIVKPLADEKSLDFSIHYHYPLPITLKTDPLRLKQIIINLCSNAIKFTHQGSVKINVYYKQQTRQLCIEVVDTGIGLDAEQCRTIFEPFNQADSSINRKYGGTGLGLALSKQLASALQGNIQVSSEPGQGSRFTLLLNVDDKTAAQLTDEPVELDEDNETEQELKDIATVNGLRVKGKVLVVEDNIVNQQLLKVFLTRINAEHEIADNGQQAIEKVKTDEFDLILMDIQMPVMDGITATRKLREQGYDKPIVALTANSSEEDRKRCIESGFDNFLTKPIDIKTFFEVITDYLHYDDSDTVQNEPIYSAFDLNSPEITKKIEGFLNLHLPGILREIENGIQQSDWQKLKTKFEELKTIAACVGFPIIIDVVKQMEFQNFNKSQLELKQLYDKLTNIADRIRLGMSDAPGHKVGHDGEG